MEHTLGSADLKLRTCISSRETLLREMWISVLDFSLITNMGTSHMFSRTSSFDSWRLDTYLWRLANYTHIQQVGSPQINLPCPLSKAQKASRGFQGLCGPEEQGLCLSELQTNTSLWPLSEGGGGVPAGLTKWSFLEAHKPVLKVTLQAFS